MIKAPYPLTFPSEWWKVPSRVYPLFKPLFTKINTDFLQALNDDLLSHQADVDDMSDRAQALSRTSGDARIASQASQLANKYQSLNIKVF